MNILMAPEILPMNQASAGVARYQQSQALRYFMRDLSGGFNGAKAPHLIEANQVSVLTDCVYRNGQWQRRPGFTLPYAATADGLSVIEIFDFVKKNAAGRLIAVTTKNVYCLVAGVWTNRLALATARATTNKWFEGEIFDTSYITNGVDAIYSSADPNTTNYTAITTSPIAISRASIVLGWNSRLLFANTTDGTNGLQPQRIYYSDVNTPLSVQATNFVDIDFSNTPITNVMPLTSGFLAVYKPDGLVTLQDTGSPNFYVPKFRSTTGLLAPKAVTDFRGGHFFVGQDGLFINTGGQVQAIGDDRVTSWFFGHVNQAYLGNIYCYTDYFNKEIIIMFADTTASTDEPNAELIYNYQYDNWTTWKQGGYCGFYQYRTVSTPVITYGHTLGNVKQIGGSTDNGTVINNVLATKSVYGMLGIVHPFYSKINMVYEQIKQDFVRVLSVYTDVQPNNPFTGVLSVGTSDWGAQSPTYTPVTLVYNTGQAPRADSESTSSGIFGRYITVQLQNFDSVSEIILDLVTGGIV
jgi:hypothetical protein